MADELNPFGGNAFGDQPFGPGFEQGEAGGLVTDTEVLALPINCVLMGQQLYRDRYRTTEFVPDRKIESVAVSSSRRMRLKGAAPSFTMTVSNKGYS